MDDTYDDYLDGDPRPPHLRTPSNTPPPQEEGQPPEPGGAEDAVGQVATAPHAAFAVNDVWIMPRHPTYEHPLCRFIDQHSLSNRTPPNAPPPQEEGRQGERGERGAEGGWVCALPTQQSTRGGVATLTICPSGPALAWRRRHSSEVGPAAAAAHRLDGVPRRHGGHTARPPGARLGHTARPPGACLADQRRGFRRRLRYSRRGLIKDKKRYQDGIHPNLM